MKSILNLSISSTVRLQIKKYCKENDINLNYLTERIYKQILGIEDGVEQALKKIKE